MSRKQRFLFVATLTQVLFGLAAVSHAQPNWEKTSHLNWGRDEVKALLEASPWSQAVERNTALAMGVSAPRAEEKLVVLLRSALPVRQALLRERQLDSRYDKMSAADRAAFDAKNKVLLDCPACGKYYVVSVTCSHTACFSGTFLEGYKKLFYLKNDEGERRELAGASPLPDGKGGAIFFFPRQNDKGEPLLTTRSKELIFHFALQAMVNLNIVNEKCKFDVAKLVRNGEVAF